MALLPPHQHRQLVCHLFKRCLKMTRDWKHEYVEYRRYAMAIRHQFDAARTLTDEREITLFIRSIEYILHKYTRIYGD